MSVLMLFWRCLHIKGKKKSLLEIKLNAGENQT